MMNVIVRIGSLSLAATLISPAAPTQLLDVNTQPLRALDGTLFDVTSGFIRVPEMREPVTGEQGRIDLAFVRVRRVGATADASAHMVLAGGPGDSGVNLVTNLAKQGGAALAELFDGDIIGVDQRGTGRSRPNLNVPVLYGLPLDVAGSPEVWLPRIEQVCREAAAALRDKGIRLEAYNTRESADDIEDVRKALGYEQLTLWGRSYGSHLALATVARHRALAKRLVLISPEGPDHTWKLPSHVDDVIRRLADRGAPDLETQLRRVRSELAQRLLSVSVKNPLNGTLATVVLGPFDLEWMVADALGDPRLLATLPAAVREMSEGKFERLAQIAMVRRMRAGVQSAMKHMMDLSSGASEGRRRQIDREAPLALVGHAINFPGMFLKDAWSPVTDLGEQFRQPVHSDVPTLILVGDLDPRTPVINAREIAATLPAARVLVLTNATHQFDVFGSAVVRSAIVRFVRGEKIADETLTLPAIQFQR